MKAALFAVALGSFFAVNASEEELENLSPEELSALLDTEASKIDWSKFTPQALGMNLNFSERSASELEKAAQAFVELGAIPAEQVDALAALLVDPRMRRMLERLNKNWPEVVTTILRDPEFNEFRKAFKTPADLQALAEIVGLKDGLVGAAKAVAGEGGGIASTGDEDDDTLEESVDSHRPAGEDDGAEIDDE